MNCVRRHQGEGYLASRVQREMCMAMLPLMHLAQLSMATNHRTHLASWAPISRAWYPDATAAHLMQGIFLLMDLPPGISLYSGAGYTCSTWHSLPLHVPPPPRVLPSRNTWKSGNNTLVEGGNANKPDDPTEYCSCILLGLEMGQWRSS